MKTPRSNFVVEYKTSRRQTQPRPRSIWGNLDLQAMARAVEADGAVPKVDLPRDLSGVEDIAAAKSEMAACGAEVDVGSPPGSPTATSSANDIYAGRVAVEDHELDDGAPSQDQLNSVPARAPRSRARQRTKRQPSDVVERPAVLDHRRDPSGTHGSEEELAALEVENRHLKRLMVAKLREENYRLRSMLRRLGGA